MNNSTLALAPDSLTVQIAKRFSRNVKQNNFEIDILRLKIQKELDCYTLICKPLSGPIMTYETHESY